jgi:hypothetical protein
VAPVHEQVSKMLLSYLTRAQSIRQWSHY